MRALARPSCPLFRASHVPRRTLRVFIRSPWPARLTSSLTPARLAPRPLPPRPQKKCAPGYDPALPGTEQLLPIFEVPPASHFARAEAASDAAFGLLQARLAGGRGGGQGRRAGEGEFEGGRAAGRARERERREGDGARTFVLPRSGCRPGGEHAVVWEGRAAWQPGVRVCPIHACRSRGGHGRVVWQRLGGAGSTLSKCPAQLHWEGTLSLRLCPRSPPRCARCRRLASGCLRCHRGPGTSSRLA